MTNKDNDEQTFTVLDGYSICSVRKTQNGWAFNSVIANILTEDKQLRDQLIGRITDELRYIGWSWIHPTLVQIGTE